MSAVSFASLTGISSIIYHYTQDGIFDSSKWFDPMRMCISYSTHLDRNQFWGNCIQMLIGAGTMMNFLIFEVPIFSFFCSTCLFLEASCQSCKSIYNEIDELTSERNDLNYIDIKKRLCKIIQLQNEMQR